jgi:6-phosphofructo-2-kinase/fructose-2,6-biphosphatase 2
VGVLVEALEDSLRYLNRGGEIAILDGTNINKDRRQLIRDRISKENGYEILWIESVYTSDEIFDQHLNQMRESPDFLDEEDYLRRVQLYKQSYETLDESEGSFVKVFTFTCWISYRVLNCLNNGTIDCMNVG